MIANNTPADRAGTLFVVATPIGNLEDLSARARSVLGAVDRILAEDTRHSGRLLQHLGISKPMISLHDHNERDRLERVLDLLGQGERLALISDAGTPLISDPGYVLVRELRARGITVVPVPGACALIAALSAAGLPTDRFVFEGFLPPKSGARKRALEQCRQQTATIVFYESPRRIAGCVADMAETFGGRREIVLARELTKTFETFYSGTLEQVAGQLAEDPNAAKGEYVVMVRGAEGNGPAGGDINVDALLTALLTELPVKKAARIVADATGLPRNDLYKRALSLKP
ncbi:16S rRNA (cytidine(1402)-2'-O)-methyltransferase [Marinobacter sp.]|uniref:16S rRNA (cytidine(1402)-2'-O)-methyltransferase n=1 Tax=Marinobacter sp. TaxID=50741 RepID=UPI00198E3FE2|nr:16S rRNA (cytidine(1402)-2'-O)-methyltransferase [Marinobacter sp.]MBC7192253.1 16S rRNA (cytidine(1402)-2'-O)-methyltransferase [Marinobacter sp.]